MEQVIRESIEGMREHVLVLQETMDEYNRYLQGNNISKKDREQLTIMVNFLEKYIKNLTSIIIDYENQ